MHWVQIARLSVLSAVTFFAIIVIGVNGHYINTTMSTILLVDGFLAWPQSSADPFSAFNIAVAAFSFISLPAMLAIDFMRRGAVTSMIVVELSWLGLLWVLWLASSAYTAASISTLLKLCNINEIGLSNLHSACKDTQASEAFGFLSWIVLTGYLVCLLAVSIMSQQRGQSVWFSSVADIKMGAFPKFGGLSGDGKDPAMNYYPQAGSQAPLHPYPPTTSPAISQGYDANTNGMGAGRQVQSSYPQV